MKRNKLSFLALLLILSFALVACAPDDNTNDTGRNNFNNRRLTTQTRIGDRSGTNDMGINDGFDNDLNGRTDNSNNKLNNGLNDGLNDGMVRPNDTNNFGNMASRANEIARKISDLPEVDKASVVISEDTALVGCTLRGNTQGTMTNALRQKIRGIVKEHARDIENISVTTDPSLTDRIRNMSNSIFQGNPIENFADDIRDLIDEITPDTNRNNLMR